MARQIARIEFSTAAFCVAADVAGATVALAGDRLFDAARIVVHLGSVML